MTTYTAASTHISHLPICTRNYLLPKAHALFHVRQDHVLHESTASPDRHVGQHVVLALSAGAEPRPKDVRCRTCGWGVER
jgi:hypothetical protein